MTGAVDWHSEIAEGFDARYERSTAFRERLDVWTELIEKHAVPGCEVLDAGCGPGVLACVAARRAKSVLGIDASPEMIAVADRRCTRLGIVNVDFQTSTLGDRGVTDERQFDVVLCSSVLEYVDDFENVLDWLIAALRPGGCLLISMPNGASWYRKAEKLLFNLTGWPTYYAHVRNMPLIQDFETGLTRRGLIIQQTRLYAGPRLVRKFIRPDLIENLFVVVATLGK